MKRNEHITPLSRDHHAGLLFSWKIKQGLKKKVSTDRLREYARYFWHYHLEQHFAEEENILFTQVKDSLIEKALAEHGSLRAMFRQIDEHADHAALYLSLATLLDDHIRYEERMLFPFLEKRLTEDQLATTGAQLAALHASQTRDTYPDEFWA